MTPKQERFVQEYLVDLCAAKAARRAGYSESTARRAADYLRKPHILDAIARAKAERVGVLKITAERVLAEYARVAFANMADYVRFGPDGVLVQPMDALTADQTAAIAEVSDSKTTRGGVVRLKLHDKLAALNALARHVGLAQPDRLVLDPLGARDDGAGPPDAYAIAREIAFALRQGEAARRPPSASSDTASISDNGE